MAQVLALTLFVGFKWEVHDSSLKAEWKWNIERYLTCESIRGKKTKITICDSFVNRHHAFAEIT